MRTNVVLDDQLGRGHAFDWFADQTRRDRPRPEGIDPTATAAQIAAAAREDQVGGQSEQDATGEIRVLILVDPSVWI
jgi:hypothetical protein